MGEPGPAAKSKERNPSIHQDLNIKPTTQDRIANKYFKPYYLNPFGYSTNYKKLTFPRKNENSNANILDIESDVNKRKFVIYKNPRDNSSRPTTAYKHDSQTVKKLFCRNKIKQNLNSSHDNSMTQANPSLRQSFDNTGTNSFKPLKNDKPENTRYSSIAAMNIQEGPVP